MNSMPNGVSDQPGIAPNALSCRGLVKRYGDIVAVAGIDLDVRPGECFGLLGPNGAGKTTTVEILEGLLVPDKGVVEILGERWGAANTARLRARLGIHLQETQLSEKLTVEETVRLFRSFFPSGRSPAEVIRLVDLEDKRHARIGKLSGGQRQRAAFACAMVGDPDILFLDEPTTGLDPVARLKIWELVEQFRASGGSVLLTTHYMEEASRLCNRVAIMDYGNVIALGTPKELISSLGADQIIELKIDDAGEETALGNLPGVTHVRRKGDLYLLSVSDLHTVLPVVLKFVEETSVRLENLATHQATLEDVFVHLTGRVLRED